MYRLKFDYNTESIRNLIVENRYYVVRTLYQSDLCLNYRLYFLVSLPMLGKYLRMYSKKQLLFLVI